MRAGDLAKLSFMRNYDGPENTSLVMTGNHENIRNAQNNSAIYPNKNLILSPPQKNRIKLEMGRKHKLNF